MFCTHARVDEPRWRLSSHDSPTLCFTLSALLLLQLSDLHTHLLGMGDADQWMKILLELLVEDNADAIDRVVFLDDVARAHIAKRSADVAVNAAKLVLCDPTIEGLGAGGVLPDAIDDAVKRFGLKNFTHKTSEVHKWLQTKSRLIIECRIGNGDVPDERELERQQHAQEPGAAVPSTVSPESKISRLENLLSAMGRWHAEVAAGAAGAAVSAFTADAAAGATADAAIHNACQEANAKMRAVAAVVVQLAASAGQHLAAHVLGPDGPELSEATAVHGMLLLADFVDSAVVWTQKALAADYKPDKNANPDDDSFKHSPVGRLIRDAAAARYKPLFRCSELVRRHLLQEHAQSAKWARDTAVAQLVTSFSSEGEDTAAPVTLQPFLDALANVLGVKIAVDLVMEVSDASNINEAVVNGWCDKVFGSITKGYKEKCRRDPGFTWRSGFSNLLKLTTVKLIPEATRECAALLAVFAAEAANLACSLLCANGDASQAFADEDVDQPAGAAGAPAPACPVPAVQSSRARVHLLEPLDVTARNEGEQCLTQLVELSFSMAATAAGSPRNPLDAAKGQSADVFGTLKAMGLSDGIDAKLSHGVAVAAKLLRALHKPTPCTYQYKFYGPATTLDLSPVEWSEVDRPFWHAVRVACALLPCAWRVFTLSCSSLRLRLRCAVHGVCSV